MDDQIGSKKYPACNGMGCSMKNECVRFRAVIDTKKEYYFPFAPIRYNEHGQPRCSYIIRMAITKTK